MNLYPKPARSVSGPIAGQSLTVSTTAVAPTGYGATVDVVQFQVGAEAVRVRTDGTNPTGDVGIMLLEDSVHEWSKSRFNSAKFIRVTAASGDAVIFSQPLQN